RSTWWELKPPQKSAGSWKGQPPGSSRTSKNSLLHTELNGKAEQDLKLIGLEYGFSIVIRGQKTTVSKFRPDRKVRDSAVNAGDDIERSLARQPACCSVNRRRRYGIPPLIQRLRELAFGIKTPGSP